MSRVATALAVRALGFTMLAIAFIPLGDAVVVLSQHGVPALAYLMHGGTAVIVALTGALLLRTSRPQPTPAQPRNA
ncbi:DUF4267 domain-containing protein [Nonomuraea sp. NPDC049152]|uniref:DUF4267 domain-containing protein n=1 Tax=Nonomuraea sp. NPDC049152 TaxID=3154350 RepID=UPI0033C04DF9